MALRDLFRRRKTADVDNPIGLGDDDGDLEVAEGGPSIFRQEIAELRWTAQQQALDLARRGVDPERWNDGLMAFEYERALARDHEGLRDRLANYVGARIRDEVRELYSLAGEVALARTDLEDVDERLLQVEEDWREKQAEIGDDELELSRYYRLRSTVGGYLKYAVAILFVISEFIISGIVFERIFANLPPGLGYVLALGVTIALIVIPHFSALGLKEGLTQYRVWEKRALEREHKPITMELERAIHMEERDDKGFRLAALAVGVGLLILIVPLSWIRATSEGDGKVSWAAFLFLLMLQLVLSGYFFLREWLDHGHLSHDLHRRDELRQELIAEREASLSNLNDAVSEFHDTAEDLIFTVQQAPRWDSYIVECFNATIRYCRDLIANAQPDYEEFIYWARVPYLGNKGELTGSGYPLDPLSEEHRSLEQEGPIGRDWLIRQGAEALAELPDPDETEAVDEPGDVRSGADEPDDVSWFVARSPDVLLEEYLGRYFGMAVPYRNPFTQKSEGEDDNDDANDVEGAEEAPDRQAPRGETDPHLQVVSGGDPDRPSSSSDQTAT